MIRNIILFVVLSSIFSFRAYADETIVYKYLDNNKYSLYTNTVKDCREDKSTKGFVTRHLMKSNYNINNIPKKYYSIKKNEDILYFGYNLTQYIISPKTPDRFKYVLWYNESNTKKSRNPLVKIEVYDVYNTLMFAFSGFDYLEGNILEDHHGKGKNNQCANNSCNHKIDGKKQEINENKNFADKIIEGDENSKFINKFRFFNNDEFYKGFRHTHTTIFKDSGVDVFLTDGINRFSVFIKKTNKKMQLESRVMYGNNFYSRVVEGYEYIMFGSITYGFMEEVIELLRGNIKHTLKFLSNGNALVKN